MAAALLPALLVARPKVLGYINSFTAIAIFLQVQRFDGVLM